MQRCKTCGQVADDGLLFGFDLTELQENEDNEDVGYIEPTENE